MEVISAVGEYTLLIKNGNEQIEPVKFSVKSDEGLDAIVQIDYGTKTIKTTISNIAVPDGFSEGVKGIGILEDGMRSRHTRVSGYIFSQVQPDGRSITHPEERSLMRRQASAVGRRWAAR